MPSILQIGREHLAGALIGDHECLSLLFNARLKGWGKPLAHGEDGTVGLFSDLDQKIESQVAFKLVEPAISISLLQQSPAGLLCALDLLQGLIGSTRTTEVPVSLAAQFQQLTSHAKSLGAAEAASQLNEISAYYRHAL